MNIAVSDVVRKSLLKGGMLPKKVIRIYGGIDARKFESPNATETGIFKSKYGLKGAFFHIGIVARFEAANLKALEKPTPKRHEVLFKALSMLPPDVDFQLLVIGPEHKEDAEALRRLAAYSGLVGQKMERVSFCGFQPDMAPVYKAMDLNVLPSPEEGFGLAVIEGMAAGVPTIGAGAGGLREIITDGVDGFLFKPGDSRRLAERIERLYRDRELRNSFVLKGKEKARRFELEKTVTETEAAFLWLLEKNNF
jgi:glycosyltransferase involved in cell wall biosynthesis